MDIMKLELKHIAPYLPYDLQFKDPETVMPGVMVSIVSGMPGLIFYDHKDNIEYYDLSAVKPLVVHLSDVHNQLEIIDELVNSCYKQIYGYDLDKTIEKKVVFSNDGFGCKFKEYDFEHGFTYDYRSRSEKSFQFTSNGSTLMLDQLELFNVLFKNHVDVFGLVDFDLAINKLGGI